MVQQRVGMRRMFNRQVNRGTQLKGPPCSTPGKSQTNGSLRRVPAWGSLLTREQPDLPAAEFSIQRGGRLPMVPGRPRQGGSLGRPGNVALGAVTEGPARRTGYHEAGIAPVAGVKDGLNLPLFHPPFQDKSGCEIWEQFGNNPYPHHRHQAISHTL